MTREKAARRVPGADMGQFCGALAALEMVSTTDPAMWESQVD